MGYKDGALFQYAPNPDIIHCPGDIRVLNSIPEHFCWDSYSGVGGFTGGDANLEGVTAGSITKQTQICIRVIGFYGWKNVLRSSKQRPVNTFGINNGTWEMHPGSPNLRPALSTLPSWVDSPAAFHGANSTFSFADGHAESRKWLIGLAITFANDMSPLQIFQLKCQ